VKKLLSLIGTFALIVTVTSPVMACLGQAARMVTELDKILINTTLNPIYIGQRNKPNGQEIKEAIKKKNSNIDIDAIVISDIAKESAIVTGNKTKYTGAAITVKFISTNFTELKGITGSVNTLIIFKDIIYVGTATSDTAGNLYRSTNGTTFSPVASAIITGKVSILTVFNDAIYVVTANSTSGKIVSNLYKSTDGINFEDITTTAKIKGTISILITFNDAIYVGTAISDSTGILYRSTNTDGTTFAPIAPLIVAGAVTSLNITNGIIYVGTTIRNSGTGHLSSILYRSTNTDGTIFVNVRRIFGLIKSWIIFNNTIYFGTAIIVGIDKLDGKLYRSTDGTTFVDVTTTPKIEGAVTSLTVFNNDLYVGTTTAFDTISSTGNLYRSDNGTNFKDVTKTATNIIGAILTLTVFNNALFVGTAISKTTGKLYRSTDSTTFEDISAKENIIGAVESLNITNNIIYVITITAADSTNGKLYKSDNW